MLHVACWRSLNCLPNAVGIVDVSCEDETDMRIVKKMSVVGKQRQPI